MFGTYWMYSLVLPGYLYHFSRLQAATDSWAEFGNEANECTCGDMHQKNTREWWYIPCYVHTCALAMIQINNEHPSQASYYATGLALPHSKTHWNESLASMWDYLTVVKMQRKFLRISDHPVALPGNFRPTVAQPGAFSLHAQLHNRVAALCGLCIGAPGYGTECPVA